MLVTGASDSIIIVWLWDSGKADHSYRIAARLSVGPLCMLPTQVKSAATKLVALHLSISLQCMSLEPQDHWDIHNYRMSWQHRASVWGLLPAGASGTGQ